LSSTNRSRALVSRAGVVALATTLAVAPAARAAAPAGYWFAGTTVVFSREELRAGAAAVALDDAGLQRLESATGATVSYERGAAYVVVATADRGTVRFAVGDAQYLVDGTTHVAPFAPYLEGRSLFVPFEAFASAIGLRSIPDGDTIVLQPQLEAIDVRARGDVSQLRFRAAVRPRFKHVAGAANHLVLAFAGLGSTLAGSRTFTTPGLAGATVAVDGAPRNPTTTVDLALAPGAHVALGTSDARGTLALDVAPGSVALDGPVLPLSPALLGAPAASPTTVPPAADAEQPAPVTPAPRVPSPPAAAPQAAALAPAAPPQRALATDPSAANPVATATTPAEITGFKTDPGGDGSTLRLSVTGDVGYEWHRLGDDRWYVDLKPATLAIPSQDVPLHVPGIDAMRIKAFVGPRDGLPTVRVALTLSSPRAVAVAADAGGLALDVEGGDDPGGPRVAAGRLAAGALVTSDVVSAPVALGGLPANGPAWKFGPTVVPEPEPMLSAATRARLIVLDPGHGGSDPGAQHNGLSEKELNLDMARRLRAILIGRGWQVRMTRDSDVDVFGPNDSARDELQARDDIANRLGARLFVSLHTNAFTIASLNGTTTYYQTPDSLGFAEAVHARLASLPTHDDGIKRENFYVIHHANMPSVLIESAFISNLGDAKLLASPAFLQQYAQAIADGVADYTHTAGSPLSTLAPPERGL